MTVHESSFQKMELNSKDDLYSTLDEIMARLSVIEQSTNEKPKEDKPKEEFPIEEDKTEKNPSSNEPKKE